MNFFRGKRGGGYAVFRRKERSSLPRWAAAALCAAFWLAVWQIAAVAVGKSVILPGPAETLARLFELASTGAFWAVCALSLGRVALGFGLAVALSCLLAAATAFVPFLRALFSPAMAVIKATPVASFIVMALVWMNSAQMPTFTAGLMVLPIVWANAHAGLLSAEGDLLEMARAFRLSTPTVFRRIYLPAALPYFTAACGTGAGLAWKAGIAAEVLGRTAQSVGRQIYDAKLYIETTDLFAWTAALIVLSVAFEKLVLFGLAGVNKRYFGVEQDAV